MRREPPAGFEPLQIPSVFVNRASEFFVRDRDGYDRVLTGAFEKVDLAIRDDYSRLPYTFIIGISRKQEASQSAP